LLFDSADGEIKDFSMKNWDSPASKKIEPNEIEYRPMVCFRTGDNGPYHLILHDPQQELTVTVPHLRQETRFTATKNEIFVYQTTSDFNPPVTYEQSPKIWSEYCQEYYKKPHKNGIELYKVEPDGKLQLVNQFEWIRPAQRFGEDLSWRIKGYFTIISPPAYNLLWHLGMCKVARSQVAKGENVVIDAFAELLNWWRPEHRTVNWLLSIVLMGLALWHGLPRRTSWARLIFWLVFVGLFNVAGLLTCWALNHTPVIKCHICGKLRGIGRIDCAHCGAQLPKPEHGKLDLILNP
jgi:hypothetical protein